MDDLAQLLAIIVLVSLAGAVVGAILGALLTKFFDLISCIKRWFDDL